MPKQPCQTTPNRAICHNIANTLRHFQPISFAYQLQLRLSLYINSSMSEKLPASSEATANAKFPPKLDVKTLLRGHDQIVLVHRGIEYRLRITRQGKLLLTK